MELREGRNSEFRRMFAELGHPVKKLRQIQLGPLKLKGLSAGGWRELAPAEVKLLKQAALGQRLKRRNADTRGGL
jgi:16S rRNA U516 pseudouridylate synthase RsuA-like enzyme